MTNILKKLFGRKAPADDCRHESDPTLASHRGSDSYFASMSQLQEAISKKDYKDTARFVRLNLRQIPDYVKETYREYGSFDISSVPALQQGGTVLALVGDDEGLAEMRQLVSTVPELVSFTEEIDRHQKDLMIFKSILEAVTAHPNCLQTDIKGLVGESDGHHIASLISYLEKAGKIVRIKEGRIYRLVISGSSDASSSIPKRKVKSHRTDRKSPISHDLEISSLAYIPLPRSPQRWEETHVKRERANILEPGDHFEVHGDDWKLVSIEEIRPEERPDPAFRLMYPSDAGLLMVDDLGKAEGLGRIEAAALRYDRSGNLAVKAGLEHDVYRIGVHPCGRGLIAMSKDCIVHAYDENLKMLFETTLFEAPEILAIRKRFEIGDDHLKNHIRCVALSRNISRYLFTAVDEAWCIDTNGEGLWGVKLPIQEGWTRFFTPSNSFGTSTDVNNALTIMKISLPITPEAVKRRYRELAKQWHPDLNPQDPQAEEKMKSLNSAAEVLTGLDATILPHYTNATFVREMDRKEFEAHGIKFTINVGMQVGEIHASDWIYAAAFSANSDSVFLAGYSGRVVMVDDMGKGVRVYDIGSVPRRIVDTGDYLYMLTDTRLYVLRDDALYAVVDTIEGGDLVVTKTGFGLLEIKRLRWFLEDGTYLGSIVSKDPIRRVYLASGKTVVETRQQRAFITGIPGWWE